MLDAGPRKQRQELGDFIRAQREKIDPARSSIGIGSRRRTPGLRREEVAQLCGLSTTWYTWIEQGRDVAASPQALVRLARALGLDRAERAYLFDLAGKRDPEQGAAEALQVPDIALRCVDAVTSPAYLLDRTWNACGWNKEAEHLFTGWLDRPGERNLLRFIFCEPAARSLIVDWEERARRVVAEFRAQCGAHLDEPVLRELIDGLRHASPDFAHFWDQHGVLGREGGERRFNHPIRGRLAYHQVTFDLASRPDVKLTILLPAPG